MLTLVTGTAVAQAIPIAISPLLSRLFTPDDFGIFALYLSVTSVLAAVSTGRYEFAITLPVDDEDAVQILWLSCILTGFTSLISFLVICCFTNTITSLLGNPQIKPWLFAIPISIFLSGVYQSFYYWFNRKKRYKVLSLSRVSQTAGSSTANLGLGYAFAGGSLGLILGNVVGTLFSTTYFVSKFARNSPLTNLRPKKKQIDSMVSRYQNFPKFDVPATFFNVGSNQVVHVFFNSFFNSTVSGNYYFVQKILGMPVALIGNAIQDVFKMEVIEVQNVGGDTRAVYLKTFRQLVVLAVIPTILMYLFVEDVFAFVFSEDWRTAGTYAQIFIPVFFLRFTSAPLSFMVYVAEKQNLNTIAQSLLFAGVIAAFLMGQHHSALATIKLLSVVFSIFYGTYIIISFSLTSRGRSSS